MAVFIRELKANFRSLLVWSISVGALLFLMTLLFPSMKGALTEAVGMGVYDNLPAGVSDALFGSLSLTNIVGFYGVEAGFMLSLGGALFGAMLGAGMLSKEEANHTAEFLFTTPVGRTRAVASKLAAIVTLIIAFNIVCIAFALGSFVAIGEIGSLTSGFWMYHLAQFLMHLEIACICFGVSAFLRRSSLGVGMGIALLLYFMSYFSGMNDKYKFLMYITPFNYAEAGRVIPDVTINSGMLASGMALALLGVIVAFVWYSRKDLAS